MRRIDLFSHFIFLFLICSANPREAGQVAQQVRDSLSYGLIWVSRQGERDDEENEADVEERRPFQRLRG